MFHLQNNTKYIQFISKIVKGKDVRKTTILMNQMLQRNKHYEATAYILRQASDNQKFTKLLEIVKNQA